MHQLYFYTCIEIGFGDGTSTHISHDPFECISKQPCQVIHTYNCQHICPLSVEKSWLTVLVPRAPASKQENRENSSRNHSTGTGTSMLHSKENPMPDRCY